MLKAASLKPYNSFGVEAQAEALAIIRKPEDIQKSLDSFGQKPSLLLGGGSNLLFRNHIQGLVLKNELKGIERVAEDEQSVTLRIGAGENWHELVSWTVEQTYYGLENLSLIPGTVGAAPVQNIGAYGAELSHVFVRLSALDLNHGKVQTFEREACEFAYRNSIFKQNLERWFILSVELKLSKQPQINTSYQALQDELDQRGEEATIDNIAKTVIRIRQSKLPDPKVLGNAGSFFKNPVISLDHYTQLKDEHPNMKSYPVDEHSVKVPAGWLIEQCGWKGRRIGDAGVHEKQALVLVNHGSATGQEIEALSKNIQEDVKQQFAVQLEAEVRII